jgi:hypothetical protein
LMAAASKVASTVASRDIGRSLPLVEWLFNQRG